MDLNLNLIGAFKKIKANKITISEKNLSKNLQTKNIPDPDLLIRTGNTKRLSNFSTLAACLFRNIF